MEDKDPCNRTYTEGLDCCVNFFLQNRSCLPCLPGSFGPNCSQNCPVGFFGNLCGGICDTCSVEDCRPDYGCPNTSTVDTTIFATQNTSTMFIQLEFTHSIDSVTCVDRSITNKGMISKMIMINGSLIIALLLVLIIIISVRKFLMFKYWKRKIESDHALPDLIETVYTEADEMPTKKSRKKRSKPKKKRNAEERNQSCSEENELERMCFKE
ncbi:platelet endothelial aggregation receptor 1-like isoform X2 [Ostrea edulis]|uniref:platelet endothelial aggregation receptor 1-like isoform X2 n=1 Tax=Ostrea edulis TaxID=37623 RepID=UPI0024AF92B8|nr:platelet endothelial aggregation receptor 1-like isoform X2 [Ostrea edulis]